jgi:ABC-type spermidine/putrescine transport system permease subunit II
MDNDIVKRLAWSGVLAASSALASVVAARLAAFAWRRMFNEEPPE